MYRWSTKPRLTSHRHDLQGQRSRSQGYMVCLTRAAHNSRMNSRRNIKIGRKFQHDTCNVPHQLQGQKGQSSRSQIDLFSHTKYLISFKWSGLRTANFVRRSRTKPRITSHHHDLQDQRSRSQGHMVCLTRPAHNSKTNSRRLIKIGSKVAHDMSNIADMLLHPGGGIP